MRPASALTPLALALSMALFLPACSKPAGDAGAPAATEAAAAATPEQIKAESERLNAWFDAKYEEQLQFSPIQLSFQGRKELNDQIDDMSEAGIRKQLAWLEASVKEMESTFDYARLDPETQLSWDLWKRQYESARDGMPFLADGYPFDQMSGMQNLVPTFLINFHQVDDEKDYLAYVSRLQKVPVVFDQLLERTRASTATAGGEKTEEQNAA